MEHKLLERQVLFRVQRGRSSTDLSFVKLIQIYKMQHHVVVATSNAVNIVGGDDTPLVRSSGWLVMTEATDAQGSPCCRVRTSTRVHQTSSPESLAQTNTIVKRSELVDLWTGMVQAKQQSMRSRLQLIAS
jgi:hypothetical protein